MLIDSAHSSIDNIIIFTSVTAVALSWLNSALCG